MADNVYEGLFLLDSNRYSRDSAGVSGRVSTLIEKHGGTLLVSRLWDERRLAYPIRGQKKGTYWLTYFRIDGQNLTALTEEAQRDDNLLRQMFLKVDPRIVDTLVSHAQQRKDGKPPASSPESSSPAAKSDDTATSEANDPAAEGEVKVAAAE